MMKIKLEIRGSPLIWYTTQVYKAVGQPLADDWAAEESVCVFDVPLKRADELADQFQQMAYVVYANGSAWLRVRHTQIRRWLA